MTRILASCIISLALISCKKSTADKEAAAVPVINQSRIQGEFAGAAVLKQTPSDLQDIMGQTPVDIDFTNAVKFKSPYPEIHYKSIDWDVVNNAIEIEPGKSEHNLKFNVPTGNTENHILLAGKRYDLLQFHFHYESEHSINGKRGDMELHLVHQDPETKKLAVLGILICKGAKSKFMGDLFDVSPLSSGPVNKFESFNPAEFLPNNNNAYFTYSGSLTTPGGGVTEPPYLEGLTWIVFNGFKTISPEQFARYQEIYPEPNARPQQPMAGRKIFQHTGEIGLQGF